MSIEMPEGLQWLSYLAGASWPKGDEDALFALGDDWKTASKDLHDLIEALHVACNTAQVSYSGDGADKMKKQFDQFFAGDQSVDKLAKQLEQLGESVRQCGTQTEYAKLQIIITLAILAAEIAYALATLWGAWAVPAMEAEAAGVCQLIGQRLVTFLANRATRLAQMPMWKLAAITGVEQAAIGLGADALAQGIQLGKGHRDSFDVKQMVISGAVGGISGAVAAPVGSMIGKRLGNWVGQESMTWWKAGGIAIGAGIPAGVVGAGAGIVANGVFTGQWEFDPAAILGGVGGGLVGGVHGVAGHAQSIGMAKGGYTGLAVPPPVGADGSHERPSPRVNEGDGGSSRASSLYDGDRGNYRSPSVHSTSDRSSTAPAENISTHNDSTTRNGRPNSAETNGRSETGNSAAQQANGSPRNNNSTSSSDRPQSGNQSPSNNQSQSNHQSQSNNQSQSNSSSGRSNGTSPAPQPATSSRVEGQTTQQPATRTGIDPNSATSQPPQQPVHAQSTDSPAPPAASQTHSAATSNLEGNSNNSTTSVAQPQTSVEQPRTDASTNSPIPQSSHVPNVMESPVPPPSAQSSTGIRAEGPAAQPGTTNASAAASSTPPSVTSSRSEAPPPPPSVTDKSSVQAPPQSPRPSISSVGDGSARPPITAGVRTDPIPTNQRASTSSAVTPESQFRQVEPAQGPQDHPVTPRQPEASPGSNASTSPETRLGSPRDSGDLSTQKPEDQVPHPSDSIAPEQRPQSIGEKPPAGLEFVPHDDFNPTPQQVAALPGHRLERIPADGDCLFRAIDHATGQTRGLGPHDIRREFVGVLRARKDQLLDRFVPNSADFREAAAEITRIDTTLRDQPDHPSRAELLAEREFRQWEYDFERSEAFDRQLDDLSRPGHYNNELGDFLIPEGADALGLHLVVVDHDGTAMHFGPQDRPEHILVRVDEAGGHYHVAEPIQAGSEHSPTTTHENGSGTDYSRTAEPNPRLGTASEPIMRHPDDASTHPADAARSDPGPERTDTPVPSRDSSPLPPEIVVGDPTPQQAPWPQHWAPVPDRTDPLFTTVARILGLPDATQVRSGITDHLNRLEQQDTRWRATIEEERRQGRVDDTQWQSELDRRGQFEKWLDDQRNLAAAPPAAPQRDSVDRDLHLAASAFGMNVVVQHPDGAGAEHAFVPGQRNVFLRYASTGEFEIGVTPEGNLFAAHRHPSPPAPLSSVIDTVVPRSEIPPPLDRVLASPQIPLLDGAPLASHYTGEGRPIAVKSQLDPIPDAKPLAVHERLPYHTPVRHMSPAELENHRLFVHEGRLFRAADGRLFDTTQIASAREGGDARAIFVMDEFGNLYAGDQELGSLHHSSFLGGRTVTAAGEIEVRDGRLVVMSDRSGHYLPRGELNDYAVDLLRRQGLSLDDNFARLGFDNQPRDRFGELDRQQDELTRRQIALDAAAEALSRKEDALDRPGTHDDADTRRIVQARRELLNEEQNELNRWRTGLDQGTVQPELRDQLVAHPNPTGPNDRITPPQPPPGLDGRNPSADRTAAWWRDTGESWWNNLRFDDLSPGYQHGLLTDFPGLRNSEGIPAAVRNTLNTTYIQHEIQRLDKIAESSSLSSNERRQLNNLKAVLTDVHTADLDSAIAAHHAGTEQPATHLLSFDQDARGRRGREVIGFGPVDSAATVHWQASPSASLGSAGPAVAHAAQQHVETARNQPDHATVMWVDHDSTRGNAGPSRLFAKLFPGSPDPTPDRLGTAIAEFSGQHPAARVQVSAPGSLAKSLVPHVDSNSVTVHDTTGNRMPGGVPDGSLPSRHESGPAEQPSRQSGTGHRLFSNESVRSTESGNGATDSMSNRPDRSATADGSSAHRTPDQHNPITAAAVPGSDFRGHVEAPTAAQVDQVRGQVDTALHSAVDGHGGLRVDPIDVARGRYRITDTSGVYGSDNHSFEVRVETQRIGDDTAARSILNHDKGQHVIQISDRISAKHVPRALAHEIGEIVADRKRYIVDKLDAFGPDEGVLRPGGPTDEPALTPHDAGRIQELRILGQRLDELPGPAERTPEDRTRYDELHREAMALVEHLGLREGTPGAGDRRTLIDEHLESFPAGRDQVRHLLNDAGGNRNQLSANDQRLLRSIQRQAGVDRAAFDAHRAELRPAFERPIADEGGKISPERTRELADESTSERAKRSVQTLAGLREQAAGGDYPKVSVIEAGGGAALAARDPKALLIDDRGRWQSDNGDRIAQTADQLRNLRQTGLGDPYQFVDEGRPDARVPLDAVRFWEDSIASQGPVVDGKASFRMENGKLLADIDPLDGGPHVTVEVEGIPVIATGFPPEIIPGTREVGGMHGTFDTAAKELGQLNTPEATAAKAQVEALSWRDPASAGEVLKILTDNNVDRSALSNNVNHALDSLANWKSLREDHPGQILSGDEANLTGVNPDLAKHWIVAGTGGTGISGVENMLKLSTDATFTMIGRNAPPGLADNTQWKEVRGPHDLGFDVNNPTAASRQNPDGSWPNPGATGRLTMAFDRTMNITGIEEHTGPQGTRFSVGPHEGDGVIASLGTRNSVPPAVADLVDTAIKRDPNSVSARMLFDNDGQYLGYRITVDGRDIDVTGAASRFFPGGQLFRPGTGSVPPLPAGHPGTVWSTQDSRFALARPEPGFAAQTASNRDAPPEGGNFDGGYVATATQATHYAAWRRSDGTDASHTITAAAVPGSDFHGHVEPPSTSHVEQIRGQVDSALHSAIDGHGNLRIDPIDTNRGEYRVTDTSGVYGTDQHSFTVRVETQRIGDDTAARSILNHDKGQHVIQISDRISTKHVPRALAHEIGEIVADRKRYIVDKLDSFGPDEGVLRPGEPTGELALTPHDAGRIQELRVLGDELDRLPATHPERDALRGDAMALVDHLGLREGMPGAQERRALVLDHLDRSPSGSEHVRTLLDDAGREGNRLPAEDQQLLQRIQDQAKDDQAGFEARRAALHPAFERPIAFDGERATPEQTRVLADESTRQRAQRSAQTLADLRTQAAAAPQGEHPKLSVIEAGGGAALAARDPQALLVDDRGRWQSDNGDRIAQTADQLRNLRQTGLGDPYQFVGDRRPDARVPLDAVRYWEDTIAAQGPVVDGRTAFRMENGKLLADITPLDGTPPITVEVQGVPVIATGFPPEIIPGIARGIGGMHGTFDTAAKELGNVTTSGAAAAKAQIQALSWRDPASAGKALEILSANGIDPSVLSKPTRDSLGAIDNWKSLRDNHPGRILSGDEANLAGVDPDRAGEWIVAGTGGTGISGVENMLKLSDNAKFTMIGRNAPPGLADNTQWKEVRGQHDLGFDAGNPTAASRQNSDGSWPNPGATGRLTMAFDRTMNITGIEERPGSRFAVAGFEGDGVIASLGTRNSVPPAVADLVDTAIKRDPNSVSARMLFDNDGQYLGYRITVDGRDIDVTGAASRFFPGGQLFKPGTGDVPPLPALNPGTVWSTQDSRYALARPEPGFAAQTASNRDAPPEGGNFDGGYVATATQATHYAAWRRSDADGSNVITAAAVPGSDFHGHVEPPSTSHVEQIRGQVDSALHSAIDGHGGLRIDPIDTNRGEYRVTDTSGIYGTDQHSFTVRVETQRIGDDTAARSILNHDKGQHVIQISDRISTKHVPRALAHEIGEIVADRRRYLLDQLDAFGPDEGVLRPGGPTDQPQLTPHDTGRIQELRVLGQQLDELPGPADRTPEDRTRYDELHREAMALVEHVGLRDGTPGAEQRRALVLEHLESTPDGRDQVRHLLDDTGGHRDQLSADDRRLLRSIQRQAGQDQAAFDAHRAALRPAFERPIAFDGERATPEQTRTLADQSTQQRAERSATTLADLREQAAGGDYPKLSVIEAGGGAALAARDPKALLIDDRGRWQSDNGDRIAQTADQLRNLRQTGLGDPYQFVDERRPGARVPLDAVRYWEDTIAAQGPVVDGKATFRMEDGKLLADITPVDRSAPLTVEVQGTPVIATGFPPEIIPGTRNVGGMHGTFDTAAKELGQLNTPEATAARSQVEALSWRDPASAGEVLTILTDNNVDRSALSNNVNHALDSLANWKSLREDHPGQILSGDEANLTGVNPDLAKHWIVAGTGGTGISGVENMLKLSTDAKFTMIGRNAPPGLADNTQWKEVRGQHDLGYDHNNPRAASKQINGVWPNPGATGRLTMSFDGNMDITGITKQAGPSPFVVAGFEGDGVIASLGTRNSVPPAVADLVDTAIKRDPNSVSARMLFDNDGQYLGYRITVDGRDIDVTGAASRFFPGGRLFKPGTGVVPPLPATNPGTVWTTDDSRYALSRPGNGFAAQNASNRDAPPEGGNFDGGYVASAIQATHYAAWRRGGGRAFS
ncbi:hypothetical protein ACFYO1_26745 [Nocardia sp. NPDC006044]|uniref:WXG100-like domain-containing protein n=1 Tax=Nocardia sp. NPDC006044 TaxID=3364306 RepID=UPI003697BD4A